MRWIGKQNKKANVYGLCSMYIRPQTIQNTPDYKTTKTIQKAPDYTKGQILYKRAQATKRLNLKTAKTTKSPRLQIAPDYKRPRRLRLQKAPDYTKLSRLQNAPKRLRLQESLTFPKNKAF